MDIQKSGIIKRLKIVQIFKPAQHLFFRKNFPMLKKHIEYQTAVNVEIPVTVKRISFLMRDRFKGKTVHFFQI